MEFRYGSSFGVEPPEAYERLILDCLLGDNTLFTRADEVEASWTWISRIHQHWREQAARRGDGRSSRATRRAAGAPRRRTGCSAPITAPGGAPGDGRRRRHGTGPAPHGSVAEQFSRGEPIAVEVDHIERALRRPVEGGERRRRGRRCRARRCGTSSCRRARRILARTREIVDELAPLLPARVLMLAEEPETADGAEADGRRRRASIESNVVARSCGARVVYSEEITLRGPARRRALRRARALAADPRPAHGDVVDRRRRCPRRCCAAQLLPATDRLVLDTGRCARPRELIEVAALRASSAGVEHRRDRSRLAAPGELPPAVRGAVRRARGRRARSRPRAA